MKIQTDRRKMRFFFYFFTFLIFVIITGAVSEMVEVKPGDPVRLNLSTSLDDISRLTVQKDGADVLRYCSSEEKGLGCQQLNSTRFSLESGEIGVSLTCPDADSSDEGAYDVEVIDTQDKRRNRTFNITIIEHLLYVRPTSPIVHSSPTPDKLPKNKTATTVIKVVICMGAIVVILVIYQKCKKNKLRNIQAEENGERQICLGSVICEAPDPKCVSIKLEDEENCTVDNNIYHSKKDLKSGDHHLEKSLENEDPHSKKNLNQEA